ncbi:hypothetical protein Vadar_026136 [Vaccinium darrowii]|uniref:Uncharacterized protein n=1 Tax=Vaccinium darrowii TaxID=229202 RepID=A0ACB7XL69_9ERIC|nr:hypothetical protein Vadar_026136 [Vaccinium darrowii]
MSGTMEGEKCVVQAEKDRLSELVFSSADGKDHGTEIISCAVNDDKTLQEPNFSPCHNALAKLPAFGDLTDASDSITVDFTQVIYASVDKFMDSDFWSIANNLNGRPLEDSRVSCITLLFGRKTEPATFVRGFNEEAIVSYGGLELLAFNIKDCGICWLSKRKRRSN